MKFKLTMIMAGVVTAVVVIVCVLNTVFLEKYYSNIRSKELVSSYQSFYALMESGVSAEEMIREMQTLNSVNNINTFLMNSNWELAYSSQNNKWDVSKWLQDFMFSHNASTVEETNQYVLQRGVDSRSNMTFLVVYGTLENGSTLIMQVVVESIEKTVEICNRFVIMVGVVVLIVSIVLVYLLAGRFTRPIRDLSTLAEQMSKMNFNVKYKGKDSGEIGMLGTSMNSMSDALEANITDLKNANLMLQRDIEVRDRNEEMRREFASNVSHELKTPIALIQGYAEGLKEGIIDDTESREYYCDVIIDESHKMNRLVKNLLLLNQLEYGMQQSVLERFNLSELAGSVIRVNQLRIEQNEITLHIDIEEDCTVLGDELQIEDVLTNYITNAVNHCSNEKIISVSLKHMDDKVRLEVHNTGANIPEESIERIWEKFYKVDKARTRSYGGNGIGLSIVKAIMENHHGAYGVRNTDTGVAFYFELEAL